MTRRSYGDFWIEQRRDGDVLNVWASHFDFEKLGKHIDYDGTERKVLVRCPESSYPEGVWVGTVDHKSREVKFGDMVCT